MGLGGGGVAQFFMGRNIIIDIQIMLWWMHVRTSTCNDDYN